MVVAGIVLMWRNVYCVLGEAGERAVLVEGSDGR